jgi:hypothetical protein
MIRLPEMKKMIIWLNFFLSLSKVDVNSIKIGRYKIPIYRKIFFVSSAIKKEKDLMVNHTKNSIAESKMGLYFFNTWKSIFLSTKRYISEKNIITDPISGTDLLNGIKKA